MRQIEPLALLRARHSVRVYSGQKISNDVRESIIGEVDVLKGLSGLDIVICFDDSGPFEGLIPKLSGFRGVHNYLLLAGRENLEERVGYFGERLLLHLLSLGLKTCWVGGSFSRKKAQAKVKKGEKIYAALAFGLSEKIGEPHKSKPRERLVSFVPSSILEERAALAVSLSPSALNHQDFRLEKENCALIIKRQGKSSFSRIDQGIAAYDVEFATNGKIESFNPFLRR